MLDRFVDPLLRRILHPPRPVAHSLPAAMATSAEDVTIPGKVLPMKAWLVRAEGRAEGLVLFVHGWGHDAGRMAPLAAHVMAQGMSALLVDLPGHGRTGPVERYNAALMVDDLRSVRNWIAARSELAAVPSAILGFSFGGLGVYAAASRDPRWAALVLIAAPHGAMEAARIYLDGKGLPATWLDGLVRRAFVRAVGAEPETFDAERNLSSSRVPVLIVHGEDDEVVPIAHAEQLEASAPRGLATMLRVPGAGHSAVLTDESVGEQVASFLRGAMRRARESA